MFISRKISQIPIKDAEKFSKTTSGDCDEKRRLALAEKYTLDKTSPILYCFEILDRLSTKSKRNRYLKFFLNQKFQ